MHSAASLSGTGCWLLAALAAGGISTQGRGGKSARRFCFAGSHLHLPFHKKPGVIKVQGLAHGTAPPSPDEMALTAVVLQPTTNDYKWGA